MPPGQLFGSAEFSKSGVGLYLYILLCKYVHLYELVKERKCSMCEFFNVVKMITTSVYRFILSVIDKNTTKKYTHTH